MGTKTHSRMLESNTKSVIANNSRPKRNYQNVIASQSEKYLQMPSNLIGNLIYVIAYYKIIEIFRLLSKKFFIAQALTRRLRSQVAQFLVKRDKKTHLVFIKT